MPDLFWPTLIVVYGACVGSFLNVVIYRMPQGISIVKPRSSCPGCKHTLAGYDNVPVLGWLWLGGKCRYCKAPISVQYPLIEACCAALFGGVYWLDYHSGLRPMFMEAGLAATWPALVMQLALVASLLAATVIDARLYIIPVRIPQAVTVAALVVLPVASVWLPAMEQTAPVVRAGGVGIAAGGAAGLALAYLLLRLKLLPRSFDEMEETLDQTAADDAFLSHPHPRREVLKESLFVGLPLLGAVVGYMIMFVPQGYVAEADLYPLAVRVLSGVVCGYLVGAGVVWGIRIFGTLAFGKEAMGLGDVHLLAGVGAVVGAMDSVLVFFVAPFLGLAGTAVIGGLGRLWKSQGRVIPYGPYLAGATVGVMIFRQPLWEFFGIL